MSVEAIEAPGPDFVIDQGYERYGEEEHAIWRTLFHRQSELLKDRAAPEFLAGLDGLGIAADDIPEFERLSDVLERATRWRIVAVPGLVPDDVFFRHLANRRFPATNFIRRWDQLDYLQEPDVFHDIYGHVPMLFNPIFADYLQAYGQGGLKALKLDSLPFLARLYWYTVEFGLVRTPAGLRRKSRSRPMIAPTARAAPMRARRIATSMAALSPRSVSDR